MKRRLDEELGLDPLGKEPAAGGLGVEHQPVIRQRRLKLRLVVVDRLDLPTRAVEVAREAEQLEEEQPSGVIGGVRLDLLHLRRDRLGEAAGLERLVGCHDFWAPCVASPRCHRW